MQVTTTPAFVRIGKRLFDFTTYADVSRAYVETCARLDRGSSNAPNCLLLDADMNQVGHVSYNGKAWHGRDFDGVCVYSPYAR